MVVLTWTSNILNLSEAVEGIGEWKNDIADALNSNGYLNVHVTVDEVNGEKNGVAFSIGHFFIGGRQFYEVVMCSGEDLDTTTGINNEIVSVINQIGVL